jgi:hypothetical protein
MPVHLKGQHWKSAKIMEQIADYYRIPSVSMNFAVAGLRASDRLVIKGKSGGANSGKIVFSNDGVHPTIAGHRIYTQAISEALETMGKQPQPNRNKLITPLNAGNFEQAGMYSVSQAQLSGNWQHLGVGDRMYERFKRRLPELIRGNTSKEALTVQFRGQRIGFYDIIGPGTCGVSVAIDGQPPKIIRRFDRYCRAYRCAYYWLPQLDDGEHTVTLTVHTVPFNKQAILKGGVGEKVSKEIPKMDVYIGNIMLVGEMIN